MAATRIIKKFNLTDYDELILKYKYNIIVNPHAYFRISESQRKVYKDADLISILVAEKPVLFGVQQNGRHTALFSRKEGYFRVAFNINETNIEIVTFYNVDTLPQL